MGNLGCLEEIGILNTSTKKEFEQKPELHAFKGKIILAVVFRNVGAGFQIRQRPLPSRPPAPSRPIL